MQDHINYVRSRRMPDTEAVGVSIRDAMKLIRAVLECNRKWTFSHANQKR
jgi:hypothetical protein